MNHRSLLAALAAMGLLLGATVTVDAASAKKGETTVQAPAKDMAQHQPAEPVMTPEKKALMQAIINESETRLLPLKEQMFAKKLELKALAQNPNTQRETITVLSQQVASLKTKIGEEMRNRMDRIEKEVGFMPHKRGDRNMDRQGCGSCGRHS